MCVFLHIMTIRSHPTRRPPVRPSSSPCDPPLRAPTITAQYPDTLLLSPSRTVSDPRHPAHEYRRRTGAATVQCREDPHHPGTPNRMPDVTVSRCWHHGHSHLLHAREGPEQLPQICVLIYDATVSHS